MTNKTITLSRELAERIANPKDCDDGYFQDIEKLRAALAEPVPPAGGEPEVVCYEYVSKCRNQVGFGTSPVFRVKERGEKNPLIRLSDHRSQVTLLQAEVERLKQGFIADLERRDNEIDSERCNGRATISSLQSELTKARELVGNWIWMLDTPSKRQELLEGMRDYLSNQSAPALIETLRANGDRIAMEATIAQQAQRIADLEADKGQGEPITYSSTQATNCAGCGKCKHTPLRVDGMGGYVCLTCIDERLEELLDAEQPASVAVVMPAKLCELVPEDWQGLDSNQSAPADKR